MQPDPRPPKTPDLGKPETQGTNVQDLIRKHFEAHRRKHPQRPWVNSRAEVIRTCGICLSLVFQALIVAKVVF